MPLSPRARILLLATLILAAFAAFIWYLNYRSPAPTPVTTINAPTASSDAPAAATTPGNAATPAPTIEITPMPGVSTSPSVTPTPDNNASSSGVASNAPSSNPTGDGSSSNKLLIPVAGITAEQLQDTYTQSRSEGRTHNAIDIIAARGTPVLAAADGQIIKLFQSERGGTTIYQLGTDQRTVYYYAHLDRYADGLTADKFARRGDTLGYVGDTGNAGAGNYHLHFSIWLITDPKHYWDGQNVNPYPLLRQ